MKTLRKYKANMTLAEIMKNAAIGEPSNADIEAALQEELAPLITFLKQAQAFDDGYPDNYPTDKRVKGQKYPGNGLNIDPHGHTLEHLISFHDIPETTDGREGQGRFLEISIWAKEHHVFNDDALITNVSLFESGKIRTWPQEYQVTRDFNPSEDTLEIFRIVLRGYLEHSIRVLNSFHDEDTLNSGPYQRTQALAEIAADTYNEALTPDTPAQSHDWLPTRNQ